MKKDNVTVFFDMMFLAVVVAIFLMIISCSSTTPLQEQPPGIEAKEEASKNVNSFDYKEDSINQQKSNR